MIYPWTTLFFLFLSSKYDRSIAWTRIAEHIPNFNMVPHPRWNTRGTRYACTYDAMGGGKGGTVFCGISLLVAGVSQVAMAVRNLYLERFLDNTCLRWSLSDGWCRHAGTTGGRCRKATVLFLGFLLTFEAVAKQQLHSRSEKDFLGVAFGRWNHNWYLKCYSLTSSPLEAGMLLGVFIGVNFLSSAVAFIAAGLHIRKLDTFDKLAFLKNN